MSQSIASQARWSVGLARAVSQPSARRAGGRTAGRRVGGALGDAAFLLLIVLLFPLAILLVGAPVALGIRLLLEIAHRF